MGKALSAVRLRAPGMRVKPNEIVPEERGFRFQHGPVARSLLQFRAIVAEAPPHVVFYHREHYAAWLRDILHELPLARRLEAYAQTPPAPDVYREIVLDLVARRVGEMEASAKPSR